jgi:hypothetical protein
MAKAIPSGPNRSSGSGPPLPGPTPYEAVESLIAALCEPYGLSCLRLCLQTRRGAPNFIGVERDVGRSVTASRFQSDPHALQEVA